MHFIILRDTEKKMKHLVINITPVQTRAFLIQNTIFYNQYDLALSFGARQERSETDARDEVNRSVAGFESIYTTIDHDTYDNSRNNYAYNFGFEKGLNKNLSFYGNYSESFRIPNIDENIKATTSGSFHLEDQESESVELGILYQNEFLNLNASYYQMDTKNEIQYDQSVNTNLDPIERQGVNIDLDYIIDQRQNISASINVTEAEFTSGSLSMGTGTTEFEESFITLVTKLMVWHKYSNKLPRFRRYCKSISKFSRAKSTFSSSTYF